MHRDKYNGKYAKIKIITVWRILNREEYSKQLVLKSGFKTADLVWESKRKFKLVIRPITNKDYKNIFYFLYFLSCNVVTRNQFTGPRSSRFDMKQYPDAWPSWYGITSQCSTSLIRDSRRSRLGSITTATISEARL